MRFVKDALVGAICMSVGYCIGTTRHHQPQHSTLEQESIQEERYSANREALSTFLQQYTPVQRKPDLKKEAFSIIEFWNALPPSLKKRILEESKDALEHQVKKGYHSLKEQSGSLYEEVKHFLNNRLSEGN